MPATWNTPTTGLLWDLTVLAYYNPPAIITGYIRMDRPTVERSAINRFGNGAGVVTALPRTAYVIATRTAA